MTKRRLSFVRSVLTTRRVAIALILLQLFVKFYVEIPNAYGLSTNLPVRETVWVLIAAWLILVPLYAVGNKWALLAGVILGLLHGALALYMPLSGTCNHFVIGLIVSIQGLLIAYFSYKTYGSVSTGSHMHAH
jgi:hypothetical protein